MRTETRLVLGVLFAIACDGPSEATDAGSMRDASHGDDGGTADGAVARDGGRDASATPDAGGDGGHAREDGGTLDAGARDAGAIQLGDVACRSNAECASGQVCDLGAPGGRCQGCAGEGSCNAGYECTFGTCLLECSGDGDCNIGMRCANFAESRYCRPRTCDDCPAPYVCSAGGCARPSCAAGEPCPAPLVCAGTHCVEP